MIRKVAAAVVAVAALGGVAFWGLTVPWPIEAAEIPSHEANLANGERIFNVGGCASCHSAAGAKGEERKKLGGGRELKTEFGIFRVPNISPDAETGIGTWSAADMVNAMKQGVSPEGEHYYPSFPYASYTRMTSEDVIDLAGYLKTLPAVSNEVAGHDLAFPYSIRRGIGLWKLAYLSDAPVVTLPADAPDLVRRGQYLVEGPGHCAECHTTRNLAGALDRSLWLAGAKNPDGQGRIPNLTPGVGGMADWSAEDIVNALETGFKPDYDSFGGSMVEVQENTALLPPEDRAAMAAYLKALPPLPDAVPPPATN